MTSYLGLILDHTSLRNAVSGVTGSIVLSISRFSLGGLATGATSKLGSLTKFAGGATSTIGRTVFSGGKKGIAIVTTPASTATSLPANIQKQDTRLNKEISIGESIYGAVSSIVSSAAILFVVYFFPRLVTFLSWICTPFARVGKWFTEEIAALKTFVEDGLQSDSHLEFGIAFVVNLVFFLVLGCVGLVVSFVKCVLNIPLEAFKLWIPISLLSVAVFITIPLEDHFVSWVDGFNSAAVLTQTGYNTAASFMNQGFKLTDVVQPPLNEQIYSSMSSAVIIYNEFAPQDSSLGSSSGRRRQLSVQPDDPRWDTLDGISTDYTSAMFIYHQIVNALFAFQASIIFPFFQEIMDVFSVVIPKLGCAFSGNIFCVALEFLNIIFVLLAELLNDILGIFGASVPLPRWGCTQGQLTTVNPNLCGGFMFELEHPPGAFYASLSLSSSSSRRRRRMQSPEEDEDPTHELSCTRHPHDGSFVERLNGRVLHVSKIRPCPLSLRVFNASTVEHALQFHRLGIGKDCYKMCLHELSYEVCYSTKKQKKTVVLLGENCTKPTSSGGGGGGDKWSIQPIEDERAHRRLASVFPDHVFSWQEQKKVVQEFRASEKEFSLTSRTKDDLVKRIEQEGKSFTLENSIQCDLRSSSTAAEQFVNMGCLGYKLGFEYVPDLMKSLFRPGSGAGAGGNRRKLQEEEDDDDDNEGKEEEEEEETDMTMEHHEHIMQRSFEVVKLMNGIKSRMKVYRAIPKSIPPLHRFRQMLRLTDPRHQSFSKMQNEEDPSSLVGDPEQQKNRRRDLQTGATSAPSTASSTGMETVPYLGHCEGDGVTIMYACPTGDCVPVADRDLCPRIDPSNPDTSYIQVMHQYVHDASLVDFDPEQILVGWQNDWHNYQEHPDTIPLTYSNLQTHSGNFSIGMSGPLNLVIPYTEVTGLNGYIDGVCHDYGNATNTCICPWYYRTYIAYDVFELNFIPLDIFFRILNFLLNLQWILYVPFFSWFPMTIVDYVWSGACGLFGVNVCPPWFAHIFGDLGLTNVSGTRRWACFFLHTGSTLYVCSMVLFIYIFLLAFWPMYEEYNPFVVQAIEEEYELSEEKKRNKRELKKTQRKETFAQNKRLDAEEDT